MATTSETIKQAGLKSLEQMSTITGRATSTLKDWYNNDRQLFDVALAGCVSLAVNPFGKWVRPETLIGAGYNGPVVYRKYNGAHVAGFIQAGGLYDDMTADPVDFEVVYKVMAFKREG